MRRKPSIACLSAATVIVTITGCGAQTHSDGSHALAKDGTFTTVIQEDPGNLHPLVTSLLSAQLVDSYAYDSLLFFDPTSGRAQPYLAKSWTDGAKRVSLYCTRTSLAQTDGTKFTAKTAADNINWIADKTNGSPLRDSAIPS